MTSPKINWKTIILGAAFLCTAAVVAWVYNLRFNEYKSDSDTALVNINADNEMSKKTVNKLKENQSLQQFLLEADDHQLRTFQLAQKELRLEIVNTQESLTQGLSGRDEIGADGMLFVFPQSRYYGIWMKQMKFDLDLIWFNQEGKVISLHKSIQALDSETEELPVYRPSKPAAMVLEAPAGFVESNQVRTGQQLTLAE